VIWPRPIAEVHRLDSPRFAWRTDYRLGASRPEEGRQGQDVLFAANSSGGGGSFAPTLLMMVLLFGAMYFLFIRPNKRRRQQIEEMQKSIGPGDEVLTVGGLYGIVSEIDDEKVVLEVSPGVSNTYTRASISRVVTAAPTHDDLEPEPEPQPGPDLKKVIDTD
jgi:preprotein translocase subunit YajC